MILIAPVAVYNFGGSPLEFLAENANVSSAELLAWSGCDPTRHKLERS